MSLPDKTLAFQKSVDNLSSSLKIGLKKKSAETKLADNTLRLNGLTETQIVTQSTSKMAEHIAKKTTDPHGITTEQLDTYTKEEFNAIPNLATLPLNVIPVDRFGELNNLPLAVTGSYEGATMNFEMREYAMNIEDDGTLLYLRNGTNGSARGVYYAFMTDPLGDIKTPTRTTRQYRPSFVPATHYVRIVCKVTEGLLLGRLADKATDTPGDWFLAEMNGTLDEAKHRACFIRPEDFPTTGAQGHLDYIIGKDAIYAFGSTVDEETWAICVYTLPLNFVTGSYVVPQRVTGFSGIGINDMMYFGKDVIRYSNAVTTNDPNVSAIVNFNNIPWQISYIFYNGTPQLHLGVDKLTGKIRIRVFGDGFFMANGQVIAPWVCFSLVYDPVTKSTVMDGSNRTAQMRLNEGGYPYVEDNPTSTIHDNRGFNTPGGNITAFDSYCWHPAGYMFGINDYQLVDVSAYIARSTPENGALTSYESMASQIRQTDHRILFMLPEYGSAFGNLFSGLTVLPSNKFLTLCVGRHADGSAGDGLVLASPGAIGWKYKTLTPGVIRDGYAPSPVRNFVTDLGKTENLYSFVVSVIDSTGTVTASGGHFLENMNTVGARSIDGNLTITAYHSVDPVVFSSVRDQVFVKLAQAGHPRDDLHSRVGIIVSQTPSIPIFGYMQWTTPELKEYMVFFSLTLTGGDRTAVMTAFSVGDISDIKVISHQGTYISDDPSFARGTGGITIDIRPDCVIVAGTTKNYVGRQNYGGGAMWRFAIPNGVSNWWNKLYVLENQFSGAWPQWISLPGIGGVTMVAEDLNTKAVYRPGPRNLTEFDAWDRAGTWQALFTQDMPSGFILYFTAPTPVLMEGIYRILPVQTIDLTKIIPNPASMTIFVYLSLSFTGVITYVFYGATASVENQKLMYIGKIVTNATTIVSIDLEKVTRITVSDNTRPSRPSLVSRGAAFMVSSGSPAEPSAGTW